MNPDEQRKLADLLEQAVYDGFSRATVAPVRVKDTDRPVVQQVAGKVIVSSKELPVLVDLIQKLILAVYESASEEKEVQKVELTNPPAPPKDTQDVKVLNFPEQPKEIKAAVSQLPGYVQELLKRIAEKDLSTSVNVAAPDIQPLAEEVGVLKGVLEAMSSELKSAVDSASESDSKAQREMVASMKLVRKAIEDIALPVAERLPRDPFGNLSTVNVAQLVTKPFDEIAATYPNTTTEVYTYKSGGVSHTVVTVVYTNSTKEVLSSVTKA